MCDIFGTIFIIYFITHGISFILIIEYLNNFLLHNIYKNQHNPYTMDVYIEKTDKKIKLKAECSGKELLDRLEINPQSVILVKKDEIVLEDELCKDSDDIKILSVISGG